MSNNIQRPYMPIAPKPVQSKSGSGPQGAKPPVHTSFAQVLQGAQEATKPLAFSAHAQQRLAVRNIYLDKQELAALEYAVAKARSKGAKESLVLSDKAAFIVSVKNNTVVTAVDRESVKENVFTNIDSAVII